MEYDELEKFMNELESLFSDFRFYILDEANSQYDDPNLSQEKVVAGLQSLQGLFHQKIGMKICDFRIDLKNKNRQFKEFVPFEIGDEK